MKKPLLILGFALVGLSLVAASCGTKPMATSTDDSSKKSETQGSVSTNTATPKTPQAVTSGGAITPALKAKTVTVSFTGTAFSPASVTLNVGDVLKVVNNSDESLQPASDPHPIHTGNTALNGKVLIKGQSFTTVALNKAGSFGMHNHLNPSQHLSVTVK